MLWLGLGLAAAGALSLVTTGVTDARLGAQRTELARLQHDLDERNRALAANQARLASQAAALRTEVDRALADTEALVQTQGSAVDRVKRLATVVRRLRDSLLPDGVEKSAP